MVNLAKFKGHCKTRWLKASVFFVVLCLFIVPETHSPVFNSRSSSFVANAVEPLSSLPTEEASQLKTPFSFTTLLEILQQEESDKRKASSSNRSSSNLTQHKASKKKSHFKLKSKKRVALIAKAARLTTLTTEDALALLSSSVGLNNQAIAATDSSAIKPEQEHPLPEGLQKIVEQAFDEPPLIESTHGDWRTLAVQQADSNIDYEYPVIPRYSMRVGSYKEQDFSDLRSSLEKIKKESVIALNTNSENDDQYVLAQGQVDEEEGHDSLIQEVEKSLEPVLVNPKKESLVNHKVSIQKDKVPSLHSGTQLASVAGNLHSLVVNSSVGDSPKKDPSDSTFKYLPSHESKVARNSINNSVKAIKEASNTNVISEISQAKYASRYSNDVSKIVGSFSADRQMDDWLSLYQGHIELHLEPAHRSDKSGQDTQFVDYRYPQKEEDDRFEISTQALHGDYTLYARVYTQGVVRPVASVPYRDLLNAQYRPKVAFSLTWNDFSHHYSYVQKIPSATKVVSLSLFEGAAGDPKKPQRVSNALVRVVGFPEWGVFRSNEKGNVRIPNLPTHSELLLDISADNYYSTQKVIPIFEADVYHVVYLVSKDKADAIKYWLKEEIDPGKGIVMGRVYDPNTREPMAGEKLRLSYEKGRTLYIDALPDTLLPQTTGTGLFAFFNIVPSFRSLTRETVNTPLLINVKKNYAEWVELARGGNKLLRGRVQDVINNNRPEAKVRLVGQRGVEVVTSENGEFKLGLDLPEGVVPVEVESPGYMTSWHMAPWDPAERSGFRNFFELPEELIKESALGIAKMREIERAKGLIMGGAEPFLFEKRNGCNTVQLLDIDGTEVSAEHGPFVWGKSPSDPKQICLNASSPRFAYYNLKAGVYVLRWLDSSKISFRSHVVYVGIDRVSMAIN